MRGVASIRIKLLGLLAVPLAALAVVAALGVAWSEGAADRSRDSVTRTETALVSVRAALELSRERGLSAGTLAAPAATDLRRETTAPTEPPRPPTIGGFRASLQRGACEQALPGTAIVWQSSGGTTQSIGAPDGSATAVGTEGSQVFCPHQPGTWTLTVTGPGGTAIATASV